MAGRFTARRAAAPELVPAQDDPSPALEGVSWTVFPEPGPEPVAAQAANPLLSDKLLDAKVRLHRRLIEEINLSALEKLPEDEIRAHIQQLVTQYILVERLALNTQELNDFVSEILDEMTGLGPLEPLLKDPTHHRHPDQRPRMRLRRARRRARAAAACASRTSSICCASSTRSCRRSAAGSTNRIRCATRACSTARASTSRCGRSASTARWSRSASSPRSRST